MGACQSTSAISEEEYERIRQELLATQQKANEQHNLLRFKIEVLVNMLGIEEKKSDGLSKRLETLKWILNSQGVSEETMKRIFMEAEAQAESETDGAGDVRGNNSWKSNSCNNLTHKNNLFYGIYRIYCLICVRIITN